MQLRCSFLTTASPEQVVDAYTDFTERRLEIWRDTLRPQDYALLDQGSSWAVVREGSLKMGVTLRYEWSEPYVVRWSILTSSFCDHGAGTLTARAAAGGGAEVDILIVEQGGKGVRGRVVLALKGLLGPSVLRRTSKRALDRLARERSDEG